MTRMSLLASWTTWALKRAAFVGIALAFVSCTAVPVPYEPLNKEFTITGPRDKVFDAALSAANSLNLNVAVLEKSSGLVRFERSVLDAFALDKYCKYPWAKSHDGAPWDTFANWNVRSVQNRCGTVTGTLSLSTLLTDLGNGTTKMSVRSEFTAQNALERSNCNSRGILEEEFMERVRANLQLNQP